MKQATLLNIQDVRVYRGTECGTDHYLLKMTLHLLHRRVHSRVKDEKDKDELSSLTQMKYALDNLNVDSVTFLYKLRLSSKLSNSTTGTAEQEYVKLKEAIHKAAFEALGEEKEHMKQEKDSWWTEELNDLVTDKKRLYNIWLMTKDDYDRRLYQQKRREVKVTIRQAKNEEWEKTCDKIEQHMGGTKTKEAWRVIKNLRREKKGTAVDMIGINEWKKYFANILKEDRQEYMQPRELEVVPEDQVNEITAKEVQEAVREMKSGKSPGTGSNPVELLKHANSRTYEILAYIFNRCLFMHDKLPEDWKLGYLTPIYKKGPKNDCANYRGITVLATMGRLYGRVIRKRLEKEITIGEEQSGFTAGRSCTDNMFSLKQIVEKRKLKNLETHLIFIDLEKAFDAVPIHRLFSILDKLNVNRHYICAIKEMYTDQKNVIKISNKISAPFVTNKGVRQGCCLSPTLFKIYIEAALHDWKRKCRYMGIPVNDECVYSLLFADDQVIMAGDDHDIEYMIRKLADTYEENGMKINYQKTKYLVVAGEARDLQVGGHTIQKCDQYKYLGSVITTEGNSRKEITNRIGQARQATQKLNSVLWSKSARKNTKVWLYNTVVQSILMYGSETWEMTKRDQQRINAVEMDFLRRSCRV